MSEYSFITDQNDQNKKSQIPFRMRICDSEERHQQATNTAIAHAMKGN